MAPEKADTWLLPAKSDTEDRQEVVSMGGSITVNSRPRESSRPRGAPLGRPRYLALTWAACILLSLLALGWPSGTFGEEGPPAGIGHYVYLDRLFSIHPLWAELQRVEGDKSALEEEWRDFVDNFRLLSSYEEGLYSNMSAILAAQKADAAPPGAPGPEAGGPETAGGADVPGPAAGASGPGPAAGASGPGPAAGASGPETTAVAGAGDVVSRRLERFEQDAWADVNSKVSRRARELATQVEDELYAERGIVNHEADLIARQVEREYLPSILNLQLKLSLLNLTQQEKDKIGQELSRLESEMKDKIAEKTKPFEERFARVVESKRKAAEAELAQYRSTLEEEAARLIQEERVRLLGEFSIAARSRDLALGESSAREAGDLGVRVRKELEAHVDAGRKDFEEAQSSFESRHSALEQRETELMGEIEADTRGLVNAYAARRGIKVAVLKSDSDLLSRVGGHDAGPGPSMEDLTPDVADFIRSYFSRKGPMSQSGREGR